MTKEEEQKLREKAAAWDRFKLEYLEIMFLSSELSRKHAMMVDALLAFHKNAMRDLWDKTKATHVYDDDQETKDKCKE